MLREGERVRERKGGKSAFGPIPTIVYLDRSFRRSLVRSVGDFLLSILEI